MWDQNFPRRNLAELCGGDRLTLMPTRYFEEVHQCNEHPILRVGSAWNPLLWPSPTDLSHFCGSGCFQWHGFYSGYKVTWMAGVTGRTWATGRNREGQGWHRRHGWQGVTWVRISLTYAGINGRDCSHWQHMGTEKQGISGSWDDWGLMRGRGDQCWIKKRFVLINLEHFHLKGVRKRIINSVRLIYSAFYCSGSILCSKF